MFYCIFFLLGFKLFGYFVSYVIGDISVKLVWEVIFLLNKIVFEIRWKNGCNELFMVVFGIIGIVIIYDFRVYMKYFFCVWKGFMNGIWGGFIKYRYIWIFEGGNICFIMFYS